MQILSTLMLVGLGFLSASLIAILLAPYIWRRAVKVTARRLSIGASDSATEIQAGRDQLRAEHALTTRKLELQLEEIKERVAEQAIEMSQLTDENEALRGELERRGVEIGRRDGEIEQLRTSMSPMETELASRGGTVHHLRETIRRLEEKVYEQDLMIQQTVKAAELKGAEIEALKENTQTQAAFDPVLSLNLSSSRIALNDQLDALSVLSNDMEQQHREVLDQQARVSRIKDEMARSTSVSADEAKNFQAQITSLEAQRSKLSVDLAEATAEAARLNGEIVQLDSAWQARDNPFAELRRRVEAVTGNVERVAKAINRESIVKSVLSALPGGRSAPTPDTLPANALPADAPQDGTAAAQAPASVPEAAVVQAAPDRQGAVASDAPGEAPALPAGPSVETHPTLPEVVQLEAIKPGLEPNAHKPRADTPAGDSAKKGTRARRVMSLAERIRSFQNEAN
ncbi:MAG: hypothetical protein ACR2PM_03550 [Hyphomicrobiales bacterium]